MHRASFMGSAVALAALVALATLAAACDERAPGVVTPDAGDDLTCPVPAPTQCPEPPLRYADVSPIFTRRCVTCHYGAVGGPWPLLQYSHAADWYDIIRANLLDCTMPPPDSGAAMTASERTAILTWILCGFPE